MSQRLYLIPFVIAFALAVSLVVVFPSFEFVKANTSAPNLGPLWWALRYSPPPPPPLPTPHAGVDYPLDFNTWGFENEGRLFVEGEVANGGFDLWYAGWICLLGLGSECKFTPLYDLDNGEYIGADRDGFIKLNLFTSSLKVFVSAQRRRAPRSCKHPGRRRYSPG